MKFISLLIIFFSVTAFLSTSYAVEFAVDPKILNKGPIINLVTSNLPKEKLIALKGETIDWDRPGIRIEQLRIVAEIVGVRFAYARVPWRRALKITQDGNSDAIFVTGFSEDRTAWGVYPSLDQELNTAQAISKVSYWLYTKRGSQVVWDGKKLTGSQIVIGAGVGDLMSKTLKEEGYNIVEVGTYEQLAMMLEKGRIDAAVSFRFLIDDVIENNPSAYPSLVKQGIPLKLLDGYLVFSKISYEKKPEIIENIWKAIGTLWEDGTMKQLFKKYSN